MSGRSTVHSPPRHTSPPLGADQVPRLLAGLGAGGGTVSLADHLRQWGPLPPSPGPSVVDEVVRSGLRGRGGAWFPVGAKWRAVHRSILRRPVVVANGAEGEPASAKDRLLLHQLPHLVLDGAMVAARAVGASQVVLHLPSTAVGPMERAVGERRDAVDDPVPPEIVVAPDRFIAGQESAVVATVNGRRPGIPTFTGAVPVRERGVDGRPTLVHNVESLAHVALVARFGAAWFRSLGTPESPGTTLVTVTGRWSEPRILEVPLGVRLRDTLALAADEERRVQGVLLGGYGGGWLTTGKALAMPYTEEDARRRGSSIGAGVVVLLPEGACPLAEISRVVAYLDDEGAGQCGPCVNGLAALARLTYQLAFDPAALGDGLASVPILCDLIDGRGACRHPDGATRFVRTGLQVFADHAEAHLRSGPCRSPFPPFLALPPPGRSSERGGRAR